MTLTKSPTFKMHLPEHFILFLNPVRHAIYFLQQLPKIARTELVTSKSRDEFFSDLQGKYKDITIIYRTSVSGAISLFPSKQKIHPNTDFIYRQPESSKQT